MVKSPVPQKSEIDIFADDDFRSVQQALEDATAAEIVKEVVESVDNVEEESHQVIDETEAGEDGVQSTIVEATDSHLKFRVRQSTRTKFDAFKAELSVALGGVRLMDSNVGRALIDWFLDEGADRVIEKLRKEPRLLQRPAAADPIGMSEFDGALVEIFERGCGRQRMQNGVTTTNRRVGDDLPGTSTQVL